MAASRRAGRRPPTLPEPGKPSRKQRAVAWFLVGMLVFSLLVALIEVIGRA